jgi:hypothetical protein
VVLDLPNYTLPLIEYYEGELGVRLPVLPVPFDEASLAPASSGLVTDTDLERLRRRIAGARDVWLVYRRAADVVPADDRVLDLLRASRPQLRADRLHGQTLWLYRFGPAATAVPGAPADLPSPSPAKGERAGP